MPRTKQVKVDATYPATQVLTASSTIAVGSDVAVQILTIAAASAIVLTSTPNLQTSGVKDRQTVILVNTGAFSITLQPSGTLANSAISADASIAIAPGRVAEFLYSSTLNAWISLNPAISISAGSADAYKQTATASNGQLDKTLIPFGDPGAIGGVNPATGQFTILTLAGTTPSTSTTTGVVIIPGTGGLGVGGRITAGSIDGTPIGLVAPAAIKGTSFNSLLISTSTVNLTTLLAATNSASSGTNWTAVGVNAGNGNLSGSYWTALGANAGRVCTGQYWTALGSQAGYTNASGNYWTAIGLQAGYFNATGSSWVAIGRDAGTSATGSNWVAIGAQAGQNATGNGNIFLGYQAGQNETGANKLYIGNSNATTPLIHGELDNKNIGFSNNSYGGGSGVVGLPTVITTPTSNPSAGGLFWVAAGVPKFRGSAGLNGTLLVDSTAGLALVGAIAAPSLNLTDATPATSATSGALTVPNGGIGVGGDSWLAGLINGAIKFLKSAVTGTNAVVQAEDNGSTSINLVLRPKLAGALIAGAPPDGTGTGGNARGLRAIDLQLDRSAATHVAGGQDSALLGGQSNTITTAATLSVICGGSNHQTSGTHSFIGGGYGNQISEQYAAIVSGLFGKADKFGQQAQATGQFATVGDAQTSVLVARATTTNVTATDLFLDGSGATKRITLSQNNTSYTYFVTINAHSITDRTKQAAFFRRGKIYKLATAASTALLAGEIAENIVGSLAWTVAVSADTTNSALKITVTGDASNTIQWVARIELVETFG